MARKRLKKYIWLPLTLALYGGAMGAYFGPKVIAEGNALTFWLSAAFYLLILVGLFFALRKKEHLANTRP